MEDRAASPSPAQLPHFCGDGFFGRLAIRHHYFRLNQMRPARKISGHPVARSN
jgi:hypothetical protein